MNAVEELLIKLEKAGIWKDVVIERNEYLKSIGTVDTNLYLVLKGSLRVFIINGAEEQCIRFGYKNSFLAALDSFITENSSPLCIQAIKKTKLKVLDKKSYLKFINSSKENLQLWQLLLEQLVFQQMQREMDLLTTSPVERFNRVLSRSPQLFQEIPHKYIASYLRMTPETLSRIQKS